MGGPYSGSWHYHHRSLADEAKYRGRSQIMSMLRPGVECTAATIYNKQAVAYEIRTWIWDVANSNKELLAHTEGYGEYPSNHLIAKIMLVAM